MREIIFSKSFWPTLHTRINLKNHNLNPVTDDFLAEFTKAITTLSIEDIEKLRYDFDKYPIYGTLPEYTSIILRSISFNLDNNKKGLLIWRFHSNDEIIIRECIF